MQAFDTCLQAGSLSWLSLCDNQLTCLTGMACRSLHASMFLRFAQIQTALIMAVRHFHSQMNLF